MSAPHTLVSGGTGFVGRFIVEALLAAGHAVTVLGRRPPPEGFFSGTVGFRRFTLEPQEIDTPLVAGGDFLVHAAFDHLPGRYRGGEGADPEGFRRRNLDGSVALFAAAKAAGVRRVVFLSSRAVYGPRPAGEELHEEDEARPDTLYGQVKLAGEQALDTMRTAGFSGISLRVTGVYGPAGPDRTHKWAGLFADYLAGRHIETRAGTEVHGSDVAAAVRLLLEKEDVACLVFNVSDVLVDRRDILSIVKRVTGCPHPLPQPADKAAINRMRCDRLMKLGWQPGGMALLDRTVARLCADFQT